MAVQLRCLLLIGLLFADLADDLLEVVLPANSIVCTAPSNEEFFPLAAQDMQQLCDQVASHEQTLAELSRGDAPVDDHVALTVGSAPPLPSTPELLALLLSLRC